MARNNNSGCLAALFGFGLVDSGRAPKPRRGIQDYRLDEDDDQESEVSPYRVRDDFLSNAERSFFGVLQAVVGERALIFSKVNLWDIFYVARPQEHRGAKSRIDRKHVDFLLCNPLTLQPIIGIELDDSSHNRPDRRERDALVNAVFETAGLPLLHVRVNYSYNTREIENLLRPYLGSSLSSLGSRLWTLAGNLEELAFLGLRYLDDAAVRSGHGLCALKCITASRKCFEPTEEGRTG